MSNYVIQPRVPMVGGGMAPRSDEGSEMRALAPTPKGEEPEQLVPIDAQDLEDATRVRQGASAVRADLPHLLVIKPMQLLVRRRPVDLAAEPSDEAVQRHSHRIDQLPHHGRLALMLP